MPALAASLLLLWIGGMALREVGEAVMLARLQHDAQSLLSAMTPGENGWRAEVQEVELGPSRDNLVVIERGLMPGDRVVTVGQQQLADGDAVRINNETEVAGTAAVAGGLLSPVGARGRLSILIYHSVSAGPNTSVATPE